MDEDDYFESERNPRNPGDSYWGAGEGAASSPPFTHTFMNEQASSSKKPRRERTPEEKAESARKAAETRKANNAAKKKAEEAAAEAKWEAENRARLDKQAEEKRLEEEWKESEKASSFPLLPTLIEFTLGEDIDLNRQEPIPNEYIYAKTYRALIKDEGGSGMITFKIVDETDMEYRDRHWNDTVLRLTSTPNMFLDRTHISAPPIYVYKFDEQRDAHLMQQFEDIEQHVKAAQTNYNAAVANGAPSMYDHDMLQDWLKKRKVFLRELLTYYKNTQ